MKVINCPKCGEPVTIDISKCVDEEGEIHLCTNCGTKFRYVER